MDTHIVERRSTEPRQYELDSHDPKIVRLLPRKAPIPMMDFGSGWYHDDAIIVSNDTESHRCM